MGNFKFHKKSGSGNGYGHHDYGRPSYGGQRGGNREMFEAVCSACGKTTTVPFRPNGKKPVFCNDCFRKEGGNAEDSSRRSFVKRPDYGRRPDFEKRPQVPQYDQQIEMLNRKIDRLTDMMKALLADGKQETAAAPKKAKKLKNATPIAITEA